MGNIAWEMSVNTALEFYKRCIVQKITPNSPDGTAILAQLAEEGKMYSVMTTNRTKEKFIQDKAKHFKILKLGRGNA